MPETLAQARLAEAAVLARTGEMDRLAAHVRAHGASILAREDDAPRAKSAESR
jgi:hypothetical protein